MTARAPMTPADIRRQVVLDEHDMASDGSLAVVARRIIRQDRYRTHLVAVPLDLARAGSGMGRATAAGARQLTDGPVRDGWPRLSPDASRVAFVRSVNDAPDAPSQLCLVPSRGGRVRRIRRGAFGSVGEVAWSPDGSRLAFTAEVDPPRFLVGPVPSAGARTRTGGVDSDSPLARRITRADWRWDGVGHLDRWSHLFVVDAASGAVPRQVTSGDWGVSDIVWSPDGRTVAFTSARGEDADLLPRSTIWAVDVVAAAAEPREVLAPGGWANHPAFSPDGSWIVAIGIDGPRPLDDLSPGLIVGPVDGSSSPRPIAADLDRPIGQWADTDLTGWMVSSRGGPTWPRADRIVATVTDRGRARPTAFDLTSGPTGPVSRRTLVDGDIVAHSLAVATHGPAAGSLSWVGTVGTRAMELHTTPDGAPAARSATRPRTTFGSAWQRRHPMPVMTRTEAPGAGGPIETWIASPPDAAHGPIATVVDVHGGPLGAWAPAPHIEVILLVAAGYRVILPNIRGSASYGRDWIRPQLGDWGGVDADDVHSAIDHAIGMGLVDTARLGVLGLSYGGFMVQWLVGTSDRFKAAVSENGVANQVSDWANSDSGPDYDRSSLLGDPFSPEGVDKLWRQSPLRHVTNVTTPLLMLQGEADLRCPPQDNEQFFIALRHLRRTVEYVLYPDESHTYGNMGRPDRRIDRQTRMLAWFDRYLRA